MKFGKPVMAPWIKEIWKTSYGTMDKSRPGIETVNR